VKIIVKEHTSSMAIEMLKGTAAGVRYTVHVSGDRDGVSTRHHAIFKVGETTVMFASGAPPVISEGDRIVVAGRMRGGGRVLLCDAYKNTSVGVRGDSGLWLNFAGMLFAFFFGAVSLGWWLLEPFIPWLPRLDETLSWFVAACGAFFTFWGFYCLYKWRRIRSAVRLVRQG
jgi:hypothetical protein